MLVISLKRTVRLSIIAYMLYGVSLYASATSVGQFYTPISTFKTQYEAAQEAISSADPSSFDAAADALEQARGTFYDLRQLYSKAKLVASVRQLVNKLTTIISGNRYAINDDFFANFDDNLKALGKLLEQKRSALAAQSEAQVRARDEENKKLAQDRAAAERGIVAALGSAERSEEAAKKLAKVASEREARDAQLQLQKEIELRDTKALLARANDEIKAGRDEIARISAASAENKRQFDGLRANNEELRAQMEQRNKALQAMQEWQKRATILEQALDDAKKGSEQANANAAAAQAAMQKRIVDLTAALEAENKGSGQVRASAAAAAAAQATMQKQLADLTAELAAIRGQLAAKDAELKVAQPAVAELARMREELKRSATESDALRDRAEAAEKAKKESDAQAREIEARRVKAEARLKELADVKIQNEELASRLAAIQKLKEGAESDLRKMAEAEEKKKAADAAKNAGDAAEIRQLQDQLARMQEVEKANADLRAQLVEAQKGGARALASDAETKKAIDALNASNAQHKKLSDELANIRNQTAAKDAEIDRLRNAAEEAKKLQDQLADQGKKLQAADADAAAKAKAHKDEFDKLQETLSKLEKLKEDNERLSAELIKVKGDKGALNAAKDAELKKLRDELAAKDAELLARGTKILQLNDDIRNAPKYPETEVNDLKRQVEYYRKEALTYDNLKVAKSDCDKLVAGLGKELEDARKALADIQKKCADEIAELQDRLKALNDRIVNVLGVARARQLKGHEWRQLKSILETEVRTLGEAVRGSDAEKLAKCTRELSSCRTDLVLEQKRCREELNKQRAEFDAEIARLTARAEGVDGQADVMIEHAGLASAAPARGAAAAAATAAEEGGAAAGRLAPSAARSSAAASLAKRSPAKQAASAAAGAAAGRR